MTFAYKGYLICRNELNYTWWIEKDGAFVCYAKDRTHAMKVIEGELS